MKDTSHHATIRQFAAARNYRDASLERWLALIPEDALALLALAEEMRLGENQLRDLWDWAEEIAARDGCSLAAVLGHPSVVAARRRKVGRNDRLKLVKEALRRLRFPRLVATEDRLQSLVQDLDLPRRVKITLPPSLEGDSIKVEFEADSPATLLALAEALRAAAGSAPCAEIFALLEEAP